MVPFSWSKRKVTYDASVLLVVQFPHVFFYVVPEFPHVSLFVAQTERQICRQCPFGGTFSTCVLLCSPGVPPWFPFRGPNGKSHMSPVSIVPLCVAAGAIIEIEDEKGSLPLSTWGPFSSCQRSFLSSSSIVGVPLRTQTICGGVYPYLHICGICYPGQYGFYAGVLSLERCHG
jgi:hypothetical protein